jgi:Uma2 family endonuclease
MDGAADLIKQAGVDLRRHRFDVDQYHRMTELGILLEDDPVELIEGELIEMPAVGVPHIGTVMALTQIMVVATLGRALVSVQSPVRLDRHNEPEPDLALLRPRADRYQAGEPPCPADVLLLIEVASSSLAYDRRVKLPLYARHGVAEVWIVDLDALVIDVHRRPVGDGYEDSATEPRGGMVEISMLPGVRIAVSDVFGPLVGQHQE